MSSGPEIPIGEGFREAVRQDDANDDAREAAADAREAEQNEMLYASIEAGAAVDARQDGEDRARDQVIAELREELGELRDQVDGEDGPPVTPPARRPVYAHLPWRMRDGRTYGANDYAQLLREREDWATGGFLYSSGAFTWGTWCQNLIDTFPDGRDLFISGKSITGLGAYLARWPQLWRDRKVHAYYQEPEDNHLARLIDGLSVSEGDRRLNAAAAAQSRGIVPGRTTDTRAQFRAKVSEAAAICRPLGVRNAVEVQAWTLVGPAHGGPEALLEMIPADDVDLIGWSFFDFRNHDLTPQIETVAEFMAEHYPGKPWGGASCGISVPVGASGPVRVMRADNAGASFDTLLGAGATHASWYDIEFPSNPDHGDLGVDEQLLPELVELHARSTS